MPPDFMMHQTLANPKHAIALTLVYNKLSSTRADASVATQRDTMAVLWPLAFRQGQSSKACMLNRKRVKRGCDDSKQRLLQKALKRAYASDSCAFRRSCQVVCPPPSPKAPSQQSSRRTPPTSHCRVPNKSSCSGSPRNDSTCQPTNCVSGGGRGNMEMLAK
eukprot:2296291-Alexandrium_andersonii.AAC.1